MRKKRGQSLLEYTIVAGLVAVVAMTMGPAIRRSAQKVVKSVADIIGFQADAEQAAELDEGFINSQESQVLTTTTGSTTHAGDEYNMTETQHTESNSITYSNGAVFQQ